MSADYYSDGFDNEHSYGEKVSVNPGTLLLIPAKGNLRAKIEAERIKTEERLCFLIADARTPPPIFWDENLISSEEGTHVFETKYIAASDEILPVSYLKNIPERLRQRFLRKAPTAIHELTDRIVGHEKETRKILHKFYEFVYEHLKLETPTTGKPIKKLLEEYNKRGFFYGNCKEARDLYIALCDAKRFPAKKVIGKPLCSRGHVWVDIFVPIENGYKLFPVDAALGYCGYHDPRYHLFWETCPHIPLLEKILNFVRRKDSNYKLSLECIE